MVTETFFHFVSTFIARHVEAPHITGTVNKQRNVMIMMDFFDIF